MRDLVFVEEELARSGWLVVEPAGGGIFGDVQVVQPHLAVLYAGEGVAQVDSAVPDGLDLGPGQRDPGFVSLQELVVEAGPPVERDRLLTLGHWRSLRERGQWAVGSGQWGGWHPAHVCTLPAPRCPLHAADALSFRCGD